MLPAMGQRLGMTGRVSFPDIAHSFPDNFTLDISARRQS
jgi:hypothetical protein